MQSTCMPVCVYVYMSRLSASEMTHSLCVGMTHFCTQPRPFKMATDRRICEIARPTSLERLLTLEETTDVTLVGADGKNPLRAHKNVLASASDFFMRMFFGESRKNWEENAKGVVRLEEFSSDAVRMIVDIVYIGRVDITLDRGYQPLLELLGASDFFNMPELKEVCHYFLRRHGREIVQSELQNLSLPLLRKILASDALGCEEIAIFKAVEQWIEAHKASLGEDDIKEILGMVRYGLIPAKELVSVVGPSKWKDEALFLAALDNWIEPDVSKIKVPQHLARANTFPLLPFAANTLCVTVKEGAYYYKVDPLPQDRSLREEHPYAGVFLAVDNLEMPITIITSQRNALSFSFGVFPKTNEQAVAFSLAVCLTHAPKSTGGLSGGHDGSRYVVSKHKDAIEIAQDPPRGNTIKHQVCSTAKHILIGVKVYGSATLKQVPSS